MKLLIPKDKAIGILRQRLSELGGANFNPKAWQDRTVLDLREIFPLGSTQWVQVSEIQFDTFITSEKQKVLIEGMQTAQQLIISYIDYIENYSSINEEREIISETNFEAKFLSLREDWNKLVPEYNALLSNNENIEKEKMSLKTEIDNLNTEIQRIKENTIQYNNLSLGKLFKAIFNMPFGQLIILIGIIVSIIGGSFGLGKLYQENVSNNELYDIKKERDGLQEKLNKSEIEIERLQNLGKKDTIKTE